MSLELEVEFCFKLLPLLEAASNSTVFSPVSILNTLAIIFSGSDGSTAKQICSLIGKGKTEKEIIKYYSEFVKGLKEDNDKKLPLKTDKKSDNEDPEDPEEISPKRRRFYDPLNDPNAKVICHITNAIFVGNNVSIVPSYKTLIKDIFNAHIQSIDFEKSENAATKINAFVSEKTNSNIKEIISAEDLSSSDGKTSLILINAIHFVGTWNLMFEEDRKDEIFNSLPSSRILSMMSNTISASQEGWNYQEEEKEGGKWQALGIPYKNCKHSLFIILPKEKDELLNLIKNFNFSLFKQCTKRQKLPRTTHVLMPIMEIEETIDLKEKLMNLGVTDLFSPECDLSKMLQEQNKIEKAFHKAIIKIDEKGTVASAGTAFRAIARSSGVITFNATHPFLYFIISNDGTKLMKPKDILFMGTFC